MGYYMTADWFTTVYLKLLIENTEQWKSAPLRHVILLKQHRLRAFLGSAICRAGLWAYRPTCVIAVRPKCDASIEKTLRQEFGSTKKPIKISILIVHLRCQCGHMRHQPGKTTRPIWAGQSCRKASTGAWQFGCKARFQCGKNQKNDARSIWQRERC